MAMIQGIDGSVLLNALRTGRSDRMAQDEYEADKAAKERKLKIEEQKSNLLGQLFGGQPQGVEAMAVPQGGTTGAGMPAAPQMAPQAPRRSPDPNVLGKLIVLDPKMGSEIVSAFKNLDEMDLKRTEAKNAMMGAAARTLAKLPQQERAQMLQAIAPQLAEAGWTAEEIARADLSDRGIKMLEATAIDLDKMIDNELAEREFQAGKTVPVTAGGNVAIVKPDGTASWAIGGGQSGDAPRIITADDYARVPPGGKYIDPDGNLRQKPGGPTPSASGDFPAGQ